MAKMTFILDSKYKDKIIYKKGSQSYSLDTDEFLKKLSTLNQKSNINWDTLPDNAIAFRGKNEFKIKLESYEDYITYKRKKYFVKWPELILEIKLGKGRINSIYAKTMIGKKLVNFEAPNFYEGNLCYGSYDPKVKDISKLSKEVKKAFQVPFTNDYYNGNHKLFFETWEDKGYAKAYKLKD